MGFKEINLRSDMADTAVTEIIYEIASCRADFCDLLRINIDMSLPEGKKIKSQAIKTLKAMKQRGSIHFFATQDNFDRMGTEAVFLLNKYPELFSATSKENEITAFIYVKI